MAKGLRWRMWKEDPHCRKCGRLTKYKWKFREPDVATIEHVYPKGHPLRATHVHVQILYCYDCNKKADWFFHQTGQLYSEFEGTLEWADLYSLKSGFPSPESGPDRLNSLTD